MPDPSTYRPAVGSIPESPGVYKFRDPSVAVTLNEEYPRLQVMRGPKRKGVRYFGPYAHAWAIRETLDTLTRVFPARTCSNGVFKRAGQIGRPCLLGYIGKCSAPCVGRVTADEHRAIVDDFVDFMAGRTDLMVKRLEREMAEAAEAMEYEKAARLRPGRPRGRRPGLPRPRRAGPRPARLDHRQGRRSQHRPARRAVPAAGLRR